MALFKSWQMEKSPPVTVILHDFTRCSGVCTYAHILSEW